MRYLTSRLVVGCLGLTVTGCGLLTASSAWSAPQDLYLDVFINGISIGKIGAFELDNGNMSARKNELTDLGLRLDGYVRGEADVRVNLSSLPGVSWTFDPAMQTISLRVPDADLIPTVIGPAPHPDSFTIESGTGAVLNYDISINRSGGQTLASGAFDARVFSPAGVMSSSHLAFADTAAQESGKPHYKWIRLDTTYTYADTRRQLTYRVGDLITDSLSWTRPVRLGGTQLSADFGMRPDLITFPLPSFSGSASVPSTIDVLVGNTKMLSQDNLTGPFIIPQLPVVTGAGTVTIAMTDALGRQVIVTKDFYASASLLRPGLQTFSVNVGKERLNWGTATTEYKKLVAGGIYRRGLTNNVTIEAAVEARTGVTMAGVGMVANLGNKALMQFALSGSRSPGLSGHQMALGLRRLGPNWSAATSMTLASPGYRDVAALSGSPVPRLQAQVNGSLSFRGGGTLGLAFVAINPGREAQKICASGSGCSGVPERPVRTRVLSVSYARQLRRASLYLTGFADMVHGGSQGVMFGLTIPLGQNRQVSASMSHNAGQSTRQIDMSQSTSDMDPFGYRILSANGKVQHQFAELEYRANWATMTAGFDQIGRDKALRAQIQGAVAFVDHHLFASRPINDSFAVVETGKLGGVTVLQENRIVGRTNAAGRLLVPALRAFDINRLAIDPADVPADITIGAAAKEVRPAQGSGVVVKFQVRSSQGALLSLVDKNRHAIPVGSVATMLATGKDLAVGYDGAVYATQLRPSNQLNVRLPNGDQCRVLFAYKALVGEIPRIGPLVCQEVPS